ncbi:hypothetical protein DKX38_007290 [Salix brachista]|uniref:Uncharacterized protein n=1 Tax=Salix brachista TaxID=2182728 RepID=A0A5N5MQC6_9ROSI|nr:hypothetical protein DKX38_007290 [Salix brachista]
MLQPYLKNGILICYTLRKWYFTALYSLNIEHCPVTTRTVQKISDALKAGSVLAQLSIAVAALNSSGIKLTKPVVSAKTSCFILGSTGIGTARLDTTINCVIVRGVSRHCYT